MRVDKLIEILQDPELGIPPEANVVAMTADRGTQPVYCVRLHQTATDTLVEICAEEEEEDV